MSSPLPSETEAIRLGDDGELPDAVDVPDLPSSVGGVEIRFTTGREVFYPTLTRSPVKEKHSKRQFPTQTTKVGNVRPAPAHDKASQHAWTTFLLPMSRAILHRIEVCSVPIGEMQLGVWLLVGGCLWMLAAIIVLISIGR